MTLPKHRPQRGKSFISSEPSQTTYSLRSLAAMKSQPFQQALVLLPVHLSHAGGMPRCSCGGRKE